MRPLTGESVTSNTERPITSASIASTLERERSHVGWPEAVDFGFVRPGPWYRRRVMLPTVGLPRTRQHGACCVRASYPDERTSSHPRSTVVLSRPESSYHNVDHLAA